MTRPAIGFIGIGLMGEAMTLRLLEQGYEVTVWNREPERLELVLPHGAVAAQSPAHVAQRCDIVLMCVLDGPAVTECVFGKAGVVRADGCRARLVVDLSTIAPALTRALAKQAADEHGLAWVDAPVSGGPAAAREGTLTIMAGGDAQAVEHAGPVLACLAANLTHMGSTGAGQTAKVLNQAIVGASFVLMTEVALLAEASGISADRLPACLAGGFADSVLLQKLYPRILARAFDPPIGYARQLSKDMQAVDAFAREHGCDLPLVRSAATRYAEYVEQGGAMADSASIVRLYEAEKKIGSS